MKLLNKTHRLWTLTFLLLVLFAGQSIAQTPWPNRPIKLVASFPAGGASDVLARLLAQKLSDGLGQIVTVENRPGATGNLGHEYAANLPGDGYALLLTSSSVLVINPHMYKRLGYDVFNDFVPISMVASAGLVVVVHPGLPIYSLAELTAYAKAKPGQINFGSSGQGAASRIFGEMYKNAVSVEITHIPYKGNVQAVNDLLAGQIQMMFSDMVPAIPQIKGGKLRPLAVAAPKRLEILPDIPTMTELGLPGFENATWWAMIAPKGTLPLVVTRINSELGKAMTLPDVLEVYTRLGMTTQHSSPAKVFEQVRVQSAAMGKLLKSVGVQPE